jgi:aminopeptidase 2
MINNIIMTNIQLPNTVQYESYDLHLIPNINTFEFDGIVDIKFKVTENMDEIVLNAKDLHISSAYIKIDSHDLITSIYPINNRLDIEKEQVIFTFNPNILNKGVKGILSIRFKGIVNDKMVGLYKSEYASPLSHNNSLLDKYCLVTQFEPTGARGMFPCADNPSFKATFNIKISVPSNKKLTVLSNTSVKNMTDDNITKVYEFNETPIMSSYLLAIFIGKMDYIETTAILPKFNKHVKLRVYTPLGKQSSGIFSLELVKRVLIYFSEYFDIDYPLDKLDLIGLPDFAAGAMENWGLITFRSRLLYVDENTSKKTRESVASVVCHELAHQWFGNLVTMKWWNDLWLNEGFATWVGTMAVHYFFPEWKVWDSFIIDELNRALELDQLKTSHPIQVSVDDISNIDEIFDAISYSKGASLIRMLVNYIGEDTFKRGIREYLEKYSYSNAETDDLWDILSNASGIDVNSMMRSWTEQTGYPLVSVNKKGDSIRVTQERYSIQDNTLWYIPLNIISGDNFDRNNLMLTDKETTLQQNNSWIKLCSDYMSFFRTKYSPELLNRLKPLILSRQLSVIDRTSLLMDMISFVQTGVEHTSSLFNLLESYRDEREYIVLNILINGLTKFHNVWEFIGTNSLVEKITDYQINFIKHLGHELGLIEKHEHYNTSLLRVKIVSRLGFLGHQTVVDNSRVLFNDIVNRTFTLSPDLIKPILVTYVKNGGEEEYRNIKMLYESVIDSSTAEDGELRTNCLIAIGYVTNNNLVNDCLDYIFKSEQVRSQDVLKPLIGLCNGRKVKIVWDYFVSNWDLLIRKYKNGHFIFGKMICTPIMVMYYRTWLNDVKQFLDNNREVYDDIKMSVEQAFEKAIDKIKWYERDNIEINNYFS